MDQEPLGLIAGQGELPLMIARGARADGRAVCCVGLREQFDPRLPELCDRFETAGVVQLGRWIRLFRRFGVTEAVMVGRVSKKRMHDPWRLLRQLPDLRAINLWYRRLRHDRRNHAVLSAVADELDNCGITLIDSTSYIQDHMATPGPMTRNAPDADQAADIEFGWPILERIIQLQIGQAIALRERDTIAIEAVEGTDAMIERAGQLCRKKGWTLLKSTDADHDRRADVPTIGVQTIRNLHAAGGRCLAVGTGRVILLEKPSVIETAESLGVSIVGIDGA
ncbi:MAG: hypothetical protein CMJ32_02070 [Phycisphaerae bacterium]|nr:hypothetical protein [Phycisphaerae bacterium]